MPPKRQCVVATTQYLSLGMSWLSATGLGDGTTKRSKAVCSRAIKSVMVTPGFPLKMEPSTNRDGGVPPASRAAVKLAIVCRQDLTGLGFQTRNLVHTLRPDRLMIIDSRPFKGADIAQHPEWYDGFEDKVTISGFPTDAECAQFLQGMTHVITCEIPYNWHLFTLANQLGIKTFLQSNWEFCDHAMNRNLPSPYAVLSPSYWHVDDFNKIFRRVVYLPPPTVNAA